MPYPAGSVRRNYDLGHLGLVGLSRVRFEHRRGRLILLAAIVAVLAVPATAALASPPAVDQYTQHLPNAGGGATPSSEGSPVARPELLPSKTREDLSGDNGRRLAQIATARELGAPATLGRGGSGAAGTGVTSADEQGFAAVAADTVLSGPGLLLIGALGGIALVGGTSSIRRGRSSGDLS
jgi:hypothetical protein